MKLEVDLTVAPEFLTYEAKFDGGDFGNETEVWVCKTSQCFGLRQGGEDEGCDIILMDKEGLLKLQSLVNQAVEILEQNNVESTD